MEDGDCKCDDTNGDDSQCKFGGTEQAIRYRRLITFVEVLKELIETESKSDERRTSPDPAHQCLLLYKKSLMKSQILIASHWRSITTAKYADTSGEVRIRKEKCHGRRAERGAQKNSAHMPIHM